MVFTYIVPYLRHIIVIGLAAVLFVFMSREPTNQSDHNKSPVDNDQFLVDAEGLRLFTDSELAQYDGTANSKGLYLVIMGYVYDVESGSKHYGPGEAYSMFVGHDATRSFITGDFEEYDPDMSDVSSLTDSELKSIVKWKSFYDETYSYQGKLIGRYFNSRGELTDYHKVVLERAAKAALAEAQPKQEFPSCNVEWKQETGTRVWCSSRSGDGIDRDWIGTPRRYIKQQEGKTPFCVCVPDDVSDDLLVPFDGCDKTSDSCFMKEAEKE